MVHLASIPDDREAERVDGGSRRASMAAAASRKASMAAGVGLVSNLKKKLAMQFPEEDDTFTTTVYGSRFAACDLPKTEMPELEMPKEVAFRLIKDDLSLDGNPMLK
jgi:glutamate decarboxylase